jgi:hypothetical protein
MKKNIDDPIIKRILIAFNVNKLNDIAMLYKITQQNLNGYIDRGTLLKLVEAELYKRKINPDWVKTGQGNMTTSDVAVNHVAELQPPYQHTQTVKISDPFIQKTAAILESPTIFSSALKSNIEAFHYAVACEEKLELANKRIDALEEHVKQIEKRLPKIVNGS